MLPEHRTAYFQRGLILVLVTFTMHRISLWSYAVWLQRRIPKDSNDEFHLKLHYNKVWRDPNYCDTDPETKRSRTRLRKKKRLKKKKKKNGIAYRWESKWNW